LKTFAENERRNEGPVLAHSTNSYSLHAELADIDFLCVDFLFNRTPAARRPA
jgi:hypothetical protein